MKKMIGLLTLILGIALMGCGKTNKTAKTNGKSGEVKTITLRVAHNSTSLDNPFQYGLADFAKKLDEVSGGKMKANVYAGTLGTNESDLAMKLSTGSVDMVVVAPGFMAATGVKEFDILSLPYLFNDTQSWENSIDGAFGDKMKTLIKEKTNNDFKVVGYYSAGIRNYYGKRPIVEPKDMKGLSIRTQNSPVQQDFWKAVGANPINVGWQELYQALSTGTADAAENDPTNMSLKEHYKTKNGKYTSLTNHDITTRLLLMNGHSFDKYTPEQQKWILEAAKSSVLEERASTVKMAKESLEKIKTDGGVINEVDIPAFKKIALTIQDKYAKENNLTDLLKLARDSQKTK